MLFRENAKLWSFVETVFFIRKLPLLENRLSRSLGLELFGRALLRSFFWLGLVANKTVVSESVGKDCLAGGQ